MSILYRKKIRKFFNASLCSEYFERESVGSKTSLSDITLITDTVYRICVYDARKFLVPSDLDIMIRGGLESKFWCEANSSAQIWTRMFFGSTRNESQVLISADSVKLQVLLVSQLWSFHFLDLARLESSLQSWQVLAKTWHVLQKSWTGLDKSWIICWAQFLLLVRF